MSITLYLFNMFSDDERADYLWKHGSHIDDRVDNEFSIQLYQLHSFYVEVYYNSKMNKIEKLRSFVNTDQLLPYLEKIHIEGLTT